MVFDAQLLPKCHLTMFQLAVTFANKRWPHTVPKNHNGKILSSYTVHNCSTLVHKIIFMYTIDLLKLKGYVVSTQKNTLCSVHSLYEPVRYYCVFCFRNYCIPTMELYQLYLQFSSQWYQVMSYKRLCSWAPSIDSTSRGLDMAFHIVSLSLSTKISSMCIAILSSLQWKRRYSFMCVGLRVLAVRFYVYAVCSIVGIIQLLHVKGQCVTACVMYVFWNQRFHDKVINTFIL